MVVRLLDAGLFRRWGGTGGQHEYPGQPMFSRAKWPFVSVRVAEKK